MEIWFSGELDYAVADAYRHASNDLEDAINHALNRRDYGCVMQWALIPIIMDESLGTYPEIKRYWRTKKETEFRLKIDYAAFKAAGDLGKRKLIFAMVLRSIGEGRRLSIPDFDFDSFERDVREVRRKHGWL